MPSQLLWVPTVRMENFGSVSVWHSDSAGRPSSSVAAGTSLRSWMSPVNTNPPAATSATRQPRIAAGRYMVAASELMMRRTTGTAAHHPPGAPGDEGGGGQECRGDRVQEGPDAGVVGEKRHDAVQFGLTGGRVVGTPTGCCMNELALMMKNADRLTAIATIQIQARWVALGQAVPPKIHRPMKVGRRRTRPGPPWPAARRKISPTNREYSLQFIPNWNSWTIPVATRWRS